MGDVIASSFRDFGAMLTDAVTQPGPWSAVVSLLVVVLVAAAMRTKLSASWLWIPVLVAAVYFSVFRWLRLR